MLERLRKVPLRWKVLLGGQLIVTLGLIRHRLNIIRADKEAKVIRKEIEAKNYIKE